MSQSHKPDQHAPTIAAPGADASLGQWLSYLETIHPVEIELGLDRVMIVLRRLFPGKPGARIITVAGTNGKGSTVAALEALLQEAGRRTAAYTSPHLQVYNERIRLLGEQISDAQMIHAFERVEAARAEVSLSYFEFGTLAAFVAMSEADVDDWILEVGLGGRLDAVNVLDADFVILTSIDIDHASFLGNDRESIGFEKAGVLRPGIPAVYADFDPPRSVLQQALSQEVDLALLGRDYQLVQCSSQPAMVNLELGEEEFRLPDFALPVKSLAAAVVASRTLAPNLGVQQIERAVAGVSVPGRFEQVASSPLVILDVGHNPHAACWLASRLRLLQHPETRIHAVYGALVDKDVQGVAKAMNSVVHSWYLAGLVKEAPRGYSAEALNSQFEQCGIKPAGCWHSVQEALAEARGQARVNDIVIVFGSFFTVAAARNLLHPSAAVTNPGA
jgi:dihydrofolate synthase/folylpolyglutamate synthase